MNHKASWIKKILRLHYLTEADFSAAIAYQEALTRAEAPFFREKFEEFRIDHRRHIRDLQEVLQEEEDSLRLPCEEPQYFHPEREELENCRSDREIMRILKSTTDCTTVLYGEAIELDFPAPLSIMLQNGFTDVLRHRAWLKANLKKEEKPTLLNPNPLLFFR